jgi:hypothetical protein
LITGHPPRRDPAISQPSPSPADPVGQPALAPAASPPRAVSQALGEHRFTPAWDEGRGLSLDDAVTYAARKGRSRKRPTPGRASLTQPT